MRGERFPRSAIPTEAGLISGNQAEAGGAAAINGDGSLLQLRDTYVQSTRPTYSAGRFASPTTAGLTSRVSPSPVHVRGRGRRRRTEPAAVHDHRRQCRRQSGRRIQPGWNGQCGNVERTIIRNNDASSGSFASVGNLTIDTGPPSTLTMRSVLLDSNDGGPNSKPPAAEIDLRSHSTIRPQ